MIPNDKSLLISKPNCGKQISFAPSEAENAAALKRAAREGYYYAVLALKQLESLATGPTGKHNVYIPNFNDVKAHSFQMFHVYLPGIRATVERRANDRYVVSKLELSDGYKAIEKGDRRPGVYSVTKPTQLGDLPKASYRKNGRVTPQDGRIVVIADGNHNTPEGAASVGTRCIAEALGAAAAHSAEFDLLYSPTGAKLGRRYDPGAITDSYAFAGLLADAMANTQNKKEIKWLAERGGAAIFTQAMEIASRQNILFVGQNHLAHLYKPSTNPVSAVKLAHALGFQLGDKFVTLGGFQPRVATSNLLVNSLRVRNKADPYSLKDYGVDLAKGAVDGVALGGVAVLGASALMPGVAAIGTLGNVLGGIGALHLLSQKARNRN